MSLDRHSDKMIAERKGRTVNHGKEAIEMALQRIASVAKILRKGAIVMLCGRSQLNENLQGDECILQQISALRRENRFLKFGLIFCLAITVALYLTACQSQSLGAKEDIYQRFSRLESSHALLWVFFFILLGSMLWDRFAWLSVKDIKARYVEAEAFGLVIGKEIVMAIVPNRTKDGLFIVDKNGQPVAQVTVGEFGGVVGVLHKTGKGGVVLTTIPWGGSVGVINNENKLVATMGAQEFGGTVGILLLRRFSHSSHVCCANRWRHNHFRLTWQQGLDCSLTVGDLNVGKKIACLGGE
jgi:hypothetical protein